MDPILRDFPYQFETERLLIRGPLPGDGAAVAAAIADSIEELRPWMPWATAVPTAEESEIRTRKKQLEFLARKDLLLLIFEKESNILVGSSGLHQIDWRVPVMEIGYWVRTQYGGSGYITEAVAGITTYAFDEIGARRVEIRCDALNVRSAAVPQRLGFVHEGTLRNEAKDHISGKLRDTMIFAKIK
ncbi:MAG: GNAT family N-acetyltransferase [Chloroflexi bacterium]|nr:GNAT family N-acetyltransferase [Chloroflexota bacterium]